jgi:hypothetical protein
VSGLVWVAKDGDEETSFRPIGDGSLTLHDSHVADWTEHLGDFEVLPLIGFSGNAMPEENQDLAR